MSWVNKFGELDVYLGADHTQLEIRVLAQMSKDERLIELVQSGEDIHASVGHELTGQPIAKIMKDRPLRTAIKGLHFGIIYGLTAESLYYHLLNEALENGEQFNMSKEDVAKLHRAYFNRFKGVAAFIEHQHQFAQDNAYVETLFGFVREIAIAGDETRNTFWANQAVNTPIQGTAHQLMLIAMAVIGIKQQTYNLLQRPSMEVHDSLYVFVKLLKLMEAQKQFVQLLEKEVLVYVAKWWPEVNWVVPLKAETKAGFRLGVMVEYNGESPEEFVEAWCQKNRKFEIELKEEMKKGMVV
jgi:DNA polymerase-1